MVVVYRQPRGQLAVQRRLDETDEERVWSRWPRFQLWVRLSGDEVGMDLAWQLNELDQLVVRRGTADHQTRILQLVAVSVVDLITMPMPLLDVCLTVALGNDRAGQQFGRIGPETHGRAKVAVALDDRDLLGHRRNDRMRRIRCKLAAVGSVEAGHVPSNLDHHALQPEAESQDRDLVLPGVADRPHLAFHASDPEAAWDNDPVALAQYPGPTLPSLAVVGADPADHDLCVVGETAGAQRLANGEVRIM